MTLPTTVRTAVSPDTLSKVTRLFNGTAGDVFAELFQNARRTGAARVRVSTERASDGRLWLTVADDGQGIGDPAALLSLGRSGWGRDTLRAEDPAGMGVFALAGRSVRIASRGNAGAWSVAVPANAWTSGAELAVEREVGAASRGTAVSFEAPEAWVPRIEADMEHAAHHYPLPVFFDAGEVARRPFLADAVRVDEWRGVEIGVFRDRSWRSDPRVNFFGVTVPCPLPEVDEVRGQTWGVLVDVVDCPDLRLVLPARKEVVATPFLNELKDACERAIYRHVAALGRHTLPFANWRRAAELGVALPEASPELDPWSPVTNDGDPDLRFRRRPEGSAPALPAEPLVVAEIGPDLEQSLARAIGLSAPELADRLVEPRRDYEGYSWYGALARIGEVVGTVQRGGAAWTTADEAKPPASGAAERIALALTVASGGSTAVRFLETDMLLVADDDSWSDDPDEQRVFVVPGPRLTPGDLADALVAAFFIASDDRDADSRETQAERYEGAALDLARRLLLGDDEADLARIRDAVGERIAWFVPKGRELRVRYAAGNLEVSLAPVAQVPPTEDPA